MMMMMMMMLVHFWLPFISDPDARHLAAAVALKAACMFHEFFSLGPLAQRRSAAASRSEASPHRSSPRRTWRRVNGSSGTGGHIYIYVFLGLSKGQCISRLTVLVGGPNNNMIYAGVCVPLLLKLEVKAHSLIGETVLFSYILCSLRTS
ncbi:hypothetical protein JB92DRAFT_2024866 [Gautieria morchelliformis]|nr:hypothetical protein JB92DRAFT_2024866 [Gautieria morchelliformis]